MANSAPTSASETATTLQKVDPLSFVDQLREQAHGAYIWLWETALTTNTVIQLVITLAAFFAAYLLARPLERQTMEYLTNLFRLERHRTLRDSLASIIFPLVWLFAQSVAMAIAQKIGLESRILNIISVLILAWIIIRLSAGLVYSRFWSKLITVVAWGFAALSILDLLEPTIAFLDNMAFSLGKLHISALGVLKAVVLLSFLMWLAVVTSRGVERRIRRSRTLTPSVQELTSKLTKVALIALAIIVSLTSVGIDLTAFAVFSGAVGVGIGFGLQKVVSNLISGIILLLDRSIKPGDVIELQETYGWINALGARFVSVITRDGKEHLIPNEDLITQKVINWSYSDTNVRLKIPVGISYDSDMHKAMDLLVEAAVETPRVLESPAPRCLLLGFGDNSVELELRIWAMDPNNGVANLKSAVLVKVWDKFHEHGIRFPFPQRDVHLDISDDSLAVLSQGKRPAGKAASTKQKAAKSTAKPAAKKKS